MTPSHRRDPGPVEDVPESPAGDVPGSPAEGVPESSAGSSAADADAHAGAHAAPHPAPARPGSWRTIGRSLAPRATRAQLMAGTLCALVGFALVVQVQANRTEGLASLRQDELVRLLDEVTQRSEQLEDQVTELRAQRAELATGTDSRRAALEAARERAEVQGILAGRLPAVGPGIELLVRQPDEPVPALVLYNVLEELRNAGAEAVQLNDVRLTASSYFVDTSAGVEVDGLVLQPPYRWLAIGDPQVIEPALNIPGGALASVRTETGTTELQPRDVVEVTAVREIDAPTFATPAPVEAP